MKLSLLLLLVLLPLSSATPLDPRDNTEQRNGKNTWDYDFGKTLRCMMPITLKDTVKQKIYIFYILILRLFVSCSVTSRVNRAASYWSQCPQIRIVEKKSFITVLLHIVKCFLNVFALSLVLMQKFSPCEPFLIASSSLWVDHRHIDAHRSTSSDCCQVEAEEAGSVFYSCVYW